MDSTCEEGFMCDEIVLLKEFSLPRCSHHRQHHQLTRTDSVSG
jgi:hypothetical protein